MKCKFGKEYDKAKELEELTDIFFFFAQMINYCDTNLDEFTKIAYLIDLDFNEWKQKYIVEGHIPVLYLIEAVSKNHLLTVSDSLIEICQKLGYTKDDILESYWKKWQKNIQRIGKEWN